MPIFEDDKGKYKLTWVLNPVYWIGHGVTRAMGILELANKIKDKAKRSDYIMKELEFAKLSWPPWKCINNYPFHNMPSDIRRGVEYI